MSLGKHCVSAVPGLCIEIIKLIKILLIKCLWKLILVCIQKSDDCREILKK